MQPYFCDLHWLAFSNSRSVLAQWLADGESGVTGCFYRGRNSLGGADGIILSLTR